MTKKPVNKRRRAGVRPRGRKSASLKSRMRNDQAEMETERLSAIKVLFRRVSGTPGDIRSFQLCQTKRLPDGLTTTDLADL